MSYTKYIGSQKKLVARTSERAKILVHGFENHGIVTITQRNVWRDEDGNRYMQWNGKFYTLHSSSNLECKYSMGVVVR